MEDYVDIKFACIVLGMLAFVSVGTLHDIETYEECMETANEMENKVEYCLAEETSSQLAHFLLSFGSLSLLISGLVLYLKND